MGDRTLAGAEAELIRESIANMVGMLHMGIEKDYFTTPAPDPRDQDVPGIFDGLHELLGGHH